MKLWSFGTHWVAVGGPDGATEEVTGVVLSMTRDELRDLGPELASLLDCDVKIVAADGEP